MGGLRKRTLRLRDILFIEVLGAEMLLDYFICYLLKHIPNGKIERWLIRVLMKVRGHK